VSFLRLGVACAVFDAAGRVLLSRRGDLNVWNLPTGRLDAHEALPEAAAREAWEETGVEVEIVQPVGLYYFSATRRLNVLYAARPVGGEVAERTAEATANRYFELSQLPEDLFAAYMVHDAARADGASLHIHTTPIWEVILLRLKLARRWVSNWLRGQPEPQHVRFNVFAVCLAWDEASGQLKGEWRVPVSGETAPWAAFQGAKWVGVWQNTSLNQIEFVFMADAKGDTQSLMQGGERVARYAEQMRENSSVWHLIDN